MSSLAFPFAVGGTSIFSSLQENRVIMRSGMILHRDFIDDNDL
jgi:hypothetical protein